MKVSDYIANFLTEKGVQYVYEVVGGMITHLIDSMHRLEGPQLVSMHHEQGAAFAADCAGRVSGIPGVAMATSGPGAINLLTGIGNAYFDSSPCLFITGQVNRSELKGNRAIRQLGFQEADIMAMARPIVKDCWQITSPEMVPEIMELAFRTAISGRPGPVLIDIPMDVQRADIDVDWCGVVTKQDSSILDVEAIVSEALESLRKAKRPLVLIGGGIRAGQSTDLFRTFANAFGVPVIHSLMALDVLPSSDPLRVGFIGSYGNRWANMALGEADALLVIGSRLDVRQTGSDTDSFKRGRSIYHVDCEPGEINNRISGCIPILMQVREFLTIATSLVNATGGLKCDEWLRRIQDNREKFPDTDEIKNIEGINPNILMRELSRYSRNSAAYVVDVGQHQMWAAQSLQLDSKQRFITSGGMGAMGFSLPAAIGACLELDGKPVTVIAGDGSFQLNMQELQTIVRKNLPIKIVIINNNCHGMVRQFQESYFDQRYQSTMWGYTAPDFARLARAYGIEATTVETPQDLDRSLTMLSEFGDQPFLLQVMVNSLANAYPKIAYGKPLTEMEPLAKPVPMSVTLRSV